MKVGNLVRSCRYRARSGPHRMVGIIIEIKAWVDSGDPENNFGTDAYVMWDSGEIINHDLYDLVRVDDENR